MENSMDLNKRMNNLIEVGNNNDVMSFTFEGNEIRGMLIDGDPYFVGKDIARALGYKRTDSIVNRKVDEEDRKLVAINSGRGIQNTYVVNESGMYTLVIGSKLPSAVKFRRWITHEVLPSIRKNGVYIYGQESMTDEQLISRALLLANQNIKQLEQKNEALENENTEKGSFMELLSGLKDRYLVTEIAHYYGMSATAFNRMLDRLGIQKKIDGIWTLTEEYTNNGYTIGTIKHLHTGNGVEKRKFTAWTKQGVMFIYYKLKDNGILPVMERPEIGTSENG